MNAHTEILPRSEIARVCRLRTQALDRMKDAAAALQAAYAISEEAAEIASRATSGATFYGGEADRESAKHLRRRDFDPEKHLTAYRRELDRSVWTALLDQSRLKDLMDREARDELEKGLATEVPEASEENVRATLEGLFADADLIFRRGLVNAFTKLDRRFKSHDGFKIGSRVIFEYAFDRDSGSMGYGGTWATIADVERVFRVLDKRPKLESGDKDALRIRRPIDAVVRQERQGEWKPRQSEHRGSYFRLNAFKNGNAHLWFTRDDLVEAANKLLAEHYGEVLPDAHDDGGKDRDDLFRSTAVSKDLAFYRSPAAVVDQLLSGLWIESDSRAQRDKPPARVLEPSAGDGSIALAAAAKGAQVRAIEVDETRCDLLRARAGRLPLGSCSVEQANFLRVKPQPVFDFVLMNPPFYGSHWMAHVRHAFDFLADGGILRAVLPASAEVNETPKHEAFRKWAQPFYDYSWRSGWEELPEESFAESGTRIQTVILHLRKR